MARKPSLSSKVVVSNRSALLSKYGVPGVTAIEKALHQLAKADKGRGIQTRLVYLDGAGLGSKRVTNPSDPGCFSVRRKFTRFQISAAAIRSA